MLLETTYGNYIFLKLSCRNLNICMIIYDDALYLVLHLKKCMNCWYEKMSIFYLIFDKEIMDFMVYYKI